MCEPVTIAAIGVAAVGTAVSVTQQIRQANYQSRTAQMNAQFAEISAGGALQRGEAKEVQSRLQGGAVMGRQQSSYGASGVVVGEGSSADILADTRLMSEYDAQMIRNNAQREAYGHRVSAAGYQAHATEYEDSGKFGAAATLIGGASDMFRMGYRSYREYKRGPTDISP